MNWPRLRPPDLLAFHLLLRMLSRWHLLLLLRDLWCKFQCFITNNMPWDIICTCLVSPKGFLLSYALNCKAAVIWCNLGGINIAFFFYLFPSIAPSSFFSLLGCCSPIHSPFTSGCLWDPAIRGLGAVLLIRLRKLPPSTTNGCVLRVRQKKGAQGNVPNAPNPHPFSPFSQSWVAAEYTALCISLNG